MKNSGCSFFFDDENIVYYGINTQNYILSEEFL
nr:MAG TPA: hypothetical protein [Caudoviricetes sp.]